MATSMRNRSDYNRQIVASEVSQQSSNNNNNSNSNNNNRKEKIIIQNQMIINVPHQQSQQQQQQQHIIVGNGQPSTTIQPPASMFTAAAVTATATAGDFNNSNNNNHEMSNIIAASPTAATYFQAQLASNAHHAASANATLNQVGASAIPDNRFPVVTYNGSNYCVITRGPPAVAEQQLPEKQDVMVHFRGHLYAGSEVKPTNIIVMSPIQSCDQMVSATAPDQYRKALTARASSN